MKIHPSSSPLITLSSLLTENDYTSFLSDSSKSKPSKYSFPYDTPLNKLDLHKVILNICKHKLKSFPYLHKLLTWFINDISNDSLSKLKSKASQLQQTLNFISTNCTIKPTLSYLLTQPSPSSESDKTLTIEDIQFKLLSKSTASTTSSSYSSYPRISLSNNVISRIEQSDFNIFHLDNAIGKDNTLAFISCYIFTTYNFYSIIHYHKFENFIRAITHGYIRSNPYHNDLHAADVTQTCMSYIKTASIQTLLSLNDFDLLTVYLSCIVHDYKHPGYTNVFLQRTHSPIALRYNDTSVLENYHISQTFKLMNTCDDMNVFASLSNEMYTLARKRMIGFVLATDMKYHNEQCAYLQRVIDNNSKANDEIKNMQQELLEIVVHASDISNPTKQFDVYAEWADKVVEEFWRQGDLEKKLGIPVSPNCDRERVTKAQTQIGFIDYVVMPFYTKFIDVFDDLKFLVDNMKANRERYKEIKDQDDKKQQHKQMKQM